MIAQHSFPDLTEQEIETALTYLDAGCSREEWVRFGMAIKSELGSAGFDIWDTWSKTAGKKYSAKDARDTWKSIKPSGGVTIGTLIREAQQFGYTQDESKREPISQQQIDERRNRRRLEEAAAEAERTRKRAEAAERANALWLAATDLDGDGHPYLERKGVSSFGLRTGKWTKGQEALLVPMVTIDGHLVSLQAIFTNVNPELGRDKDYLPGGQRRGSFHLIGGKPVGSQAVIVVCEGYATGATIHQATGHCVAVAFDAGNLLAVARDLRQLFGVATIVVAADNDNWTDGNPGIHHARQAASAASAIVAVPKFESLDGKPTDFNDLHQRQGIEAVREQIGAAIPTAANDNHLELDSNVNPFMFPHLSERQQPLNTWENLSWMMEQYGITARYNVIKKDVTVDVPGKHYGYDSAAGCALSEINSLCARNRMPKADTADYLKYIGTMNSFNPVSDFILSKPWDGVTRIKALCDTLETEPGFNRDLVELLIRRWLVSAVAAALLPSGFWSKGVLVLQGEQSLGKSAWFKALVPNDQRQLIKVGANIDPANKDTISSAISHWMVELGELDGTFRKADIAKLKGFISSDMDLLRKPYDRLESTYQRRTVFFASVNPKHFLADETGNVRWWTIPVTAVNYAHDIDTQQLWAEVASQFREGERWWLEAGEEAALEVVNREHESVDPLEEMLQTRFSWGKQGQGREMTATEVLLEVGFDRPTKTQATDCSRLLQKMTGNKPRKSGSKRLFSMPPKAEDRTAPPF